MDNVLLINACVRPGSRTLELVQTLLYKLPGEVQEAKLYEMALPALDLQGMVKRNLADQNQDYSDPSFDGAKQFAAADIVVVAAPYWDLMFPAILKNYMDLKGNFI